MEKILYLAHTNPDGSLPRVALEVITSALALQSQMPGATLQAGLVGSRVQDASAQLRGAGIRAIYGVHGPEFENSRYASDAAAIDRICREARPSLILAPATSRWNRVLPGSAFRLKGRIDTHVCGLSAPEGVLQIGRWFYRQRIRAVFSRSTRPWIILVDPGNFEPWAGPKQEADISRLKVKLTESEKRTTVDGVRQPEVAEQTIRPDSELLLVAGAGWTKTQADGQVHVREAEKLILGFLKLTGASLGGSKSSVDMTSQGQKALSFMTHLNQVGQTGSSPRHLRGLATCCHGEEPHVIGWRFINERRAVNLDPNCGWAHGKADVLYVADAFQVISKINQLLQGGSPSIDSAE